MTIFLVVALSLLGGIHFYLWLRLVRDTQLPPPARGWTAAAIIGLALLPPLAMLFIRMVRPGWWGALAAWPAFTWLGFMFLLLVLVLLGDAVRLLFALSARLSSAGALDPTRRLFIARAVGGGAALMAGAAGAFAINRALARVEVKELTIKLPRLATESHGMTIVQLTDLHVGPTIGRAFIEEIVRRTNALTPDIVAITGDLVDGSVERLRDAVAPLADLRARHGVYFVTGNHEYFSGVADWMRELGRLGIRVLNNERVSIGAGASGFDLAGIEDFSAARLSKEMAPDLGRALAGRNPERALVLLAHQPKAVIEAAELGVGLQLSGHTHGGQIWPFTYLVKLQQPYVAGLHRHGETQIYVSPGTGYWGPPMRLGTRAEITRITLVA